MLKSFRESIIELGIFAVKTKTANLFIARVLIFLWGMVFLSLTQAAPLGLVLSGGGAKGSYEVGVWSALHEAGLAEEVVAISGTSIGAVNAALFASWPDPKGAERLWLENLGKVFIPNEKILQLASEKKLTEFRDAKLREYADIAGIPAEKLPATSRTVIAREAEDEFRRKGILKDLVTASKTYEDSLAGKASDGLCDGAAMRSVLEDNLPKNWPGATPRVYVTALACDKWKLCTFCLNEGTSEDRVLRLLASTAIPVVMPPVMIEGRNYVDGGWEANGGDNVPIKPLLENHPKIKTVIVVFLKDKVHIPSGQRERVVAAATSAGVRLVEIIPSIDIGQGIGGWQGVFDTSHETARRLIELGRKDARKVLTDAGLTK